MADRRTGYEVPPGAVSDVGWLWNGFGLIGIHLVAEAQAFEAYLHREPLDLGSLADWHLFPAHLALHLLHLICVHNQRRNC